MNIEETQKILSYLRSNYQHSFKDEDVEVQKMIITSWHHAFKDIPYEVVGGVVMSIVENEDREFAPNIAHVKSLIAKATDTTASVDEAWQEVKRSLQTWSYAESWKTLSPEVKEIVSVSDLQDWGEMSHESIEKVVYPHFRDRYNRHIEKKKTVDMLPDNVKALLGIESPKPKMMQIDYGAEAKERTKQIEAEIKRLDEERRLLRETYESANNNG